MSTMVVDMLGGGAGGPTGSNQNTGYAATYYPARRVPAKRSASRSRSARSSRSVDIQLQPVTPGEDQRHARSAPTASRWPTRW